MLDSFIQKKLKYVLALKQAKDYEEAEEELLSALKEAPGNPLILTSIADLYSRQNRLDEALHIAEEVLQKDSHSQRALVIKGDINLKRKKYKKAVDYFKNAIHTGSTPYINKRLAQALLKGGQYTEAMEFCRQVLLREPDNPVFMRFLARAYKKLEYFKEARELYEKLLKKCPDDKFIYKEYIELKAVDKTPGEFTKDLEAIMKVSSASENIHLRLLFAGTLKKAKRFSEAIEQYEKCLLEDPKDSYILKQAGFCYMKMEDYEKAINVLSSAFLFDPGDYYVKSSLMSAYGKRGKLHDFVKLIDRAIKKHPHEKALWGFKKKVLNKL